MYHTQNDYFPVVRAFVELRGVAYFEEIYNHVEKTIKLNSEDVEILPSALFPRYKQILRNLRSNKTFEQQSNSITPVDGGFATVVFAKANGLGVFSTGNKTGTTRVGRGPSYKTARDAWAANIFDEAEMIALRKSPQVADAKKDLDILSPVDFAKKYSLTW
jgi:hypothetical protein